MQKLLETLRTTKVEEGDRRRESILPMLEFVEAVVEIKPEAEELKSTFGDLQATANAAVNGITSDESKEQVDSALVRINAKSNKLFKVMGHFALGLALITDAEKAKTLYALEKEFGVEIVVVDTMVGKLLLLEGPDDAVLLAEQTLVLDKDWSESLCAVHSKFSNIIVNSGPTFKSNNKELLTQIETKLDNVASSIQKGVSRKFAAFCSETLTMASACVARVPPSAGGDAAALCPTSVTGSAGPNTASEAGTVAMAASSTQGDAVGALDAAATSDSNVMEVDGAATVATAASVDQGVSVDVSHAPLRAPTVSEVASLAENTIKYCCGGAEALGLAGKISKRSGDIIDRGSGNRQQFMTQIVAGVGMLAWRDKDDILADERFPVFLSSLQESGPSGSASLGAFDNTALAECYTRFQSHVLEEAKLKLTEKAVLHVQTYTTFIQSLSAEVFDNAKGVDDIDNACFRRVLDVKNVGSARPCTDEHGFSSGHVHKLFSSYAHIFPGLEVNISAEGSSPQSLLFLTISEAALYTCQWVVQLEASSPATVAENLEASLLVVENPLFDLEAWQKVFGTTVQAYVALKARVTEHCRNEDSVSIKLARFLRTIADSLITCLSIVADRVCLSLSVLHPADFGSDRTIQTL